VYTSLVVETYRLGAGAIRGSGELYVGHDDDAIVATVALEWSDVMIRGERAPDAGYVHRLVVRRDRAGAGLGAVIIDWAAARVRSRARALLRLDATADNLPLCSYYERLGFVYQGDAEGEIELPDGAIRRWRDRLYERDCGVT
jgi:GNAT superfamily N-acetyltransferase